MRVPIRKAGKYTQLKLDHHITGAKLKELKNTVDRLKKVSLPPAAQEVQRLAAMGDFSENAAYQMAKGRLRSINQRILELEDQVNHAVIIQRPKATETIQIGHSVTVEINSKKKTYLILGSAEADPRAGIISQSSPIGSALIGHKVGDRVTMQQAGKEITCRILTIE